MELVLKIKHRLNNRLRINFSKPIKHFKKLKSQVLEHSGIESFDYNPLSQNVLVFFNNEVVKANEILIRVAVAYSVENNMIPVKITQKGKGEFITSKGIFSGLCIVTAVTLNLFSKNLILKKATNWISAVTTAAAVIEHAEFDYRKKGSVDPEVLSIGLLVNSVVSNQRLLIPTALTWVSTFGRHFSTNDNEGIVLEVARKKEENKKIYYHLNVSKLPNRGTVADLFHQLSKSFALTRGGFRNTMFDGSKDLMNSHDEFIEGVGKNINGMVLHFNQ
ncbi:hypothetical protein [Marinifilum caeruleilacunae]|uniref:Uncharacterized protein n=1 Tax=Marinifilum caeruleilacunae TaxID=2499076 RepID=A0ABX1WXB1_9BACT|nr:hypothetical protein [Marinifilum caeruleilacunae]NOU60714.1 hypothetical protein [Marinifilum caeruleilacunae]